MDAMNAEEIFKIDVVILTALLSLAASLITAFLTSKITQKNEMRKRVHEKRFELYLEFHNVLEKMLKNRKVVFEREYYDEVCSFKAKIKLLASKRTIRKYKNLFMYLQSAVKKYEEFEKSENPEQDNGRIVYDDNGTAVDYNSPSEWDWDNYNDKIEKYKQEKCLSKELTQKLIDGLYSSMRDDLGSNL